jgi:HEAT repeat protein
VRRRALSVAGKTGAPSARRIIERGFTDAESSVREGAMLAAAQVAARNGPGAAELAAKVARELRADGWQERVSAARALGEAGARADRKALGRAAVGDEKAFVREAAAAALGRLGAHQALPVLIRAASFEREKVDDVRVAAAVSIGQLALSTEEGGRARAALAEIARRDPSEAVRRAAARSIQKK